MSTIEELQTKLATATTEAEYDAVMAELQAAEKAETLKRNQAAKAEREAAEVEAAKKLAAHKAGLRKREKLLEHLAAEDQAIFDDLQALHARYLQRYADEEKLNRLNIDLNFEARDLDQHPIELRRMTVVNLDVVGTRNGFVALEELVKQYNLTAGQILSAEQNRIPHPEKPELEWFARADGSWPGK